MYTLLNQTITAAQATTSTAADALDLGAHRSLLLQANFTYGSGGTTVDAYVQSSSDGGTTWSDLCNFHFTTSSQRRLFNLSSLTAVASQATPTDGAIAANTSVDGLSGDRLRVKWSSSGTYAGGTTLVITAVPK